jgi:hypothetical protein
MAQDVGPEFKTQYGKKKKRGDTFPETLLQSAQRHTYCSPKILSSLQEAPHLKVS